MPENIQATQAEQARLILSPVTSDRIMAILEDERFLPVGLENEGEWRAVIAEVRTALADLTFSYPLGPNPNLGRNVCRPFDREFSDRLVAHQNPLITIIRERLGRWLNLSLRLTFLRQFDALIGLVKRHNGLPITTTDIRTAAGEQCLARMRTCANEFGPKIAERQLAWALMGEFLARVADTEQANFSIEVQDTMPSTRKRGRINHSAPTPSLIADLEQLAGMNGGMVDLVVNPRNCGYISSVLFGRESSARLPIGERLPAMVVSGPDSLVLRLTLPDGKPFSIAADTSGLLKFYNIYSQILPAVLSPELPPDTVQAALARAQESARRSSAALSSRPSTLSHLQLTPEPSLPPEDSTEPVGHQ